MEDENLSTAQKILRTDAGLPLRPSTFPMSVPHLVPKRTRRDSKRDGLLRVAREEFASKGFLGTHIAVVAARVGIRKSTFFHYYADKEALYEAAVGALLNDVADAVDAAATATADFGERLDVIVECLRRHVRIDPALPRLVLRGLIDTPPEEVARPTALDRIGARIVETVELGIQGGHIPPGDASQAAPAILAIICLHDGAALLPLDLPESEPLIGLTPDMKVAEIKDRVRRFLAVN